MAQFVTRDELRTFAEKATFNERVELAKSLGALPLTGSTFLSHSSKDQDLVAGAVVVLNNHGAKVYVDEIDPEMPPYTTEETAALLKQRIGQTKRFVLLASKNSKESRWVPWELGIADGYKGLQKIALFPASDSTYDTTWASWEYLGLYRRIVWGRMIGREKPLWMVHDHRRNEATPLEIWLAGS